MSASSPGSNLGDVDGTLTTNFINDIPLPKVKWPLSRLARFIVADMALMLLLIGLLFVIQTLSVDVYKNEFLLVLLGPHGVVFGTLLPLTVLVLVLAGAIWLLLSFVARLKR